MSTDRVLPWEGCLNARDLGGLPTADGRRVRPRALIRTDLLCRLTPVGQASLLAHGVRTIVDLRWAPEIARDDPPHPFREAGPHGLTYLNIPVDTGRTAEQNDRLSPIFAAARTRVELNRLEVDANPVGLATIVTAIARAPAGGVVVHCNAGKDRTGIVVALVLSLLGVPDDEIAADYALSRANLDGLTREWLDRQTQDPAERARLVAEIADPSPEAMLDLLAYLRAHHGGAEAYLLGGGMLPADLAALRSRLLDD